MSLKVYKNQNYSAAPHIDMWEQLKAFTDARIALGRTGCSIPTQHALDFQWAHAQAKDAVYHALDIEGLSNQLQSLGISCITVSSQAETREIYLKRPDLGRLLSESSRSQLSQLELETHYDVCVVVGDGLSARAIEENALPFIKSLIPLLQEKSWKLAPLVIASQSRVALGDQMAELFQADMLVMLIGERPGLSSPDSMGIYYTWKAHTGSIDAERNCISNIRSAGLNIPTAVQRLIALMSQSKQRQYSGVNLKDEHEIPIQVDPIPKAHLFKSSH